MANIAAAREEVQKVVSLLVNRFGHEHEVFEHLTLALNHLGSEEAEPTVEIEAKADMDTHTETVIVGKPEIESWGEMRQIATEPLPKRTPRRTRRKRQ